MSEEANPSASTSGSGFDADVVAREAMSKDPSLDGDLALELAREASSVLTEMSGLDAPELSRRLLTSVSGIGASTANVIATAAVEHCRRLGVHPAG